MTNIAIVEDEKLFSLQLRQFLETYAGSHHLELSISLFSDGAAFLETFHCEYDIIFMDVKMPGMNGFDVASEVRKKDRDVLLLFVTNLAQYAIRGYEVDALDYIVKPLNYHTFEMKFEKALDQAALRRDQYLLVSTKDATFRLSYREITYLEILRHRLYYHTATGVHLALGSHTLKEAEAELNDPIFCKCSSCYLVNLSHVTSLEKDLVHVGKDTLKISRQRKKSFTDALLQYYQGGLR